MDYRQLFRQMGFISRQAMMKMNQEASNYGLDNNLFLLLIRIVENEGMTQSQLAEGLLSKRPKLKIRNLKSSILVVRLSNSMTN